MLDTFHTSWNKIFPHNATLLQQFYKISQLGLRKKKKKLVEDFNNMENISQTQGVHQSVANKAVLHILWAPVVTKEKQKCTYCVLCAPQGPV